MTPHDLLADLKRAGVVVTLAGDRLHVEAPRGTITEDLRRLLVERKPELVAALAAEVGWPPESLDAERRFGHGAARLYPFLGRLVRTPRGLGRLVQVFTERLCVVLDDDPDHAAYFLPSEVRPPGLAVGSTSTELEVH